MRHGTIRRAIRRAIRLGLGGLAALLLAATAAAVEPGGSPTPELQTRMTGHFVLDEPRADVEARLAKQVDQAASAFNFMIRPIARSRIGRAAVFCGAYQLALNTIEVTVVCDTLPPVQRKLDNSEPRLTGLDGEALETAVKVSTDSVSLDFKAPDGERTTTYRFDGKGRMEIQVQVSSPSLEKPMGWKIRYRRAS